MTGGEDRGTCTVDISIVSSRSANFLFLELLVLGSDPGNAAAIEPALPKFSGVPS